VIPTKKEAELLLTWANEQNPGVWIDHSRVVARAAETIAERCSLDANRAYVSGLLHDIGRYEGVSHLRHVYCGYELMKTKGYDRIAEICLSHSFPCQNICEYFGENDCTPEETNVLKACLSKAEYDDYDNLIQLCDAMGTAAGVSLIDVRLMDVIRRYGFSDQIPNKIETTFKLKSYFDNLCSMNVYDLFYDEIRDVSFR